MHYKDICSKKRSILLQIQQSFKFIQSRHMKSLNLPLLQCIAAVLEILLFQYFGELQIKNYLCSTQHFQIDTLYQQMDHLLLILCIETILESLFAKYPME